MLSILFTKQKNEERRKERTPKKRRTERIKCSNIYLSNR